MGRFFVGVVVVVGLLLVLASSAGALSNAPLQTWQANGRVSAIGVANGVAYLGGGFTAMISPTGQTVARAHLAAVDEASGKLLGWHPGTNGSVSAVRVANGVVYVGGSFTQAGSQKRAHAAAFTTAGKLVSTWHPAFDASVNALAVLGSTVYLGGNFTHANATPRNHLAAVATSGALIAAWHPSADAVVRSLATDKTTGRVYVGGDFIHISGSRQPYLAALSASSGAVDAWANHPTGRVWGIAIDGPNLYAAVGGHVPAGEAAAFNATTGHQLWSRWTDGDAQTIAATNGSVYVGGHFINTCATHSGGGSPWVCTTPVARTKLMQLTATTGNLQPWNPTCDAVYGVWTLRATTTHILIGGDFTHVDNQHHWHYTTFLR